jgi:GDP-L-fucose synthase
MVGSYLKKLSTKESNGNEWIFLSSKDCDLLDPHATDKYFATVKPDAVVHLAANVGGLFKNMYNKVRRRVALQD